MPRLYDTKKQFVPAEHVCRAELPDGTTCQNLTTSWGYCPACTSRYYAIQDAQAQLKRRGARRQDYHDMTRRRLRSEGIDMDSKALMATTEKGMLARIEAGPRFIKDLTVPEKKMLAQAAITYGFDPLMGELTIYQGRPYVSIDGRYRKAQETGKLDGVSSRPANKVEREEWSIPVEDFFFRAEVRVKGAAYPFVGWGRVKSRELTEKSKYHPEKLASPVVADNPQRMAEKRAEAQALRKAFHIPLPNAEEIGLEDEPLTFPAVTVVEPSTGEVIDTIAQEVPAETASTQPVAPSAPPAEPTPVQPERIKPSTYDRMRTLAGENWDLLMKDIKRKHNCLTMEMTESLAQQYIAVMEKKAGK